MTLKEMVLDLDQARIFSLYLDISVEDINNATMHSSNKVINNHRGERSPSMGFRYYGSKLICRDFGDIRYSGDVFELVGYILNKRSSEPNDFIDICNHILQTYHSNCNKVINKDYEIIDRHNGIITTIETEDRPLQKRDFDNYSKFGILRSTVEQYVVPVRRYIINGVPTGYKNSYSDPCYKYTSNHKFLKLYFPNRHKSSKYPRFITNNPLQIEDLTDIQNSIDLLLVKSIKDKMLIKQMLSQFKIESDDIQILTASSEFCKLDHRIVDMFKTKITGSIYSMFDADNAGLTAMKCLQEEYDYKPILFSTDAKDPTDYARAFGYNNTLEQFKNILDIIYTNRI